MPLARNRSITLWPAAEETAGVGTVIKFPDDGRIVRFGREAGESATIIILPVIRIERYPDSFTGSPAPAIAAARRKWRPAARQAPVTNSLRRRHERPSAAAEPSSYCD